MMQNKRRNVSDPFGSSAYETGYAMIDGSGDDVLEGDSSSVAYADHGDGYLDGEDGYDTFDGEDGNETLTSDGGALGGLCRLLAMKSQRWRNGEQIGCARNDGQWRAAA